MNAIKNDPIISIIIPVYKAEKYLERCILSVVNQTYRNLEIILVDDGSPDQSGKMCDNFAIQDSRIRVIHQENQGVSSARNAGLDCCSGDFVAFIDSDDYILPEMYEQMLLCVQNNHVDIAVSQWQYETCEGKHVVSLKKVNLDILGIKTSLEFASFLYKGSYENGVVVAAWNKLYSRRIFDTIRFQGRYCEDDRIHDAILSKMYNIYVMPQQFYIYCENDESLTHGKFNDNVVAFLEILEERCKYFIAMISFALKLKSFIVICISNIIIKL